MYGNERWEYSGPMPQVKPTPESTPEIEITIKVKGVAAIKPQEIVPPKDGYAADGSVLPPWA
jgi:hypothetical protein